MGDDAMRICVICEGCYPFVAGGVSSWLHGLMRAMPQHEFVIWAIGAQEKQRGHFAYELPKNVVDYLMNAGPECETPKAFPNNTYYLLNTLPDSCIYAKQISEEMGIPAVILTSFLEGESRDVGTMLASIAREIQAYGNPVQAPCVLLASGEATTQILDNSTITGHGGPSQEETLSFALSAAKAKGVCLLSMDSEGTDGTTSVAGGITDSTSYKTALEKGVDIHASLRGHASFEALDAMGDAVFTGNTGTNLCDFNVMYVPKID